MEVKQLDDYFGYTEKGSSLEGELRAGSYHLPHNGVHSVRQPRYAGTRVHSNR